MRRIHTYKVAKEPVEDMVKANRFNPCLEFTFRDKKGQHIHKISTGYGDTIHVYRHDLETYVLSLNPRLDYAGLEVIEGSERSGNIFLEGNQLKEILGKVDLAPFTIIKRLRQYIN